MYKYVYNQTIKAEPLQESKTESLPEKLMIEYSPGMRVIIRDEEWMIRKVETNSLDEKTIHCVGISPLVKDHEAIFLSALEKKIELVDPAKVKLVIDDSPFFRKSRLFIESQWRQQIPTDSAIHIGNKAAMDPMPFQLDPAQIALRRPRQRILIADTVGLGKTLEAGILISELIARGKGKRILVVTVKSMMTQFQKELWNRFTIPLVRLDSTRIQKIRASLPSNYNPFFYYDKTIISIDTLKSDIQYRTHLENAFWDIIVIDEAHNTAVRGSHQAQRSRLAALLASRSDTLIMLSATPHDGRAESFASLMNMLDPTAIANPHDYRKEDIKGLCIRRFKKDVKNQISGVFKERQVTLERCQASAAEEYAYKIFTGMELEMDNMKTRGSGELFKTGLEKSLFSSPAACIKSIQERVKKLEKRKDAAAIHDIRQLRVLQEALEQIEPRSFSRYQKLLEILKSQEYNWDYRQKDDRIVIFTERIETMNTLAKSLREDLNVSESAVQTLFGGMSDSEQQRIVEEFGRKESKIRILVASDVASEGINLHYLSHRLIHFDIPWSLMVFQQRNGRIDRYGQTNTPDIRYFLIQSNNEEIKGDMRIMEILVTKEEQAYKNIGDPALLMGKFNIDDEEQFTAAAIETNIQPDTFAEKLDGEADEFDLYELMMADAAENEATVEIHEDTTLFTDMNYLKTAFRALAKEERHPIEPLQTVEGVEVTVTPALRRRLGALLPEEALPATPYLRLSPDKAFIMEDMKRSLQNNLEDTAWPSTQYLWKQHPIFDWINDKAGLLFGRGEAPLIAIPSRLPESDLIFIIAGLIPNRKSAPVIDEWFGLRFSNGQFAGKMTMEQLIALSGLRKNDIPNPVQATQDDVQMASALLPKVIPEAEKELAAACRAYRARIDPEIHEELTKLSALETRHKDYQLSLFESERKKEEQKRLVEDKFYQFTSWVRETLEIEEKPYLRVIAVLKGKE